MTFALMHASRDLAALGATEAEGWVATLEAGAATLWNEGLRVEMRHEIAKLHQSLDTTMIHVTREQVEATTLADRIVVLEFGRIAQAGRPRELCERPANLFAARFIGSPAMNVRALADAPPRGGGVANRQFRRNALGANEERLPEPTRLTKG